MNIPPSSTLTEVITRALTDDAFRADLANQPDQALQPYNLDPKDRAILDSIHSDLIEGFAKQLNSQSSTAAAAVAMAAVGFKR